MRAVAQVDAYVGTLRLPSVQKKDSLALSTRHRSRVISTKRSDLRPIEHYEWSSKPGLCARRSARAIWIRSLHPSAERAQLCL